MRVFDRADWGARYGRGYRVDEPWDEVVIHTEAGAVRSADLAALAGLQLSLDEAAHMRAVESYHVKTRGWDGIGYSWFIHRDGTICEGRGWGYAGAHTETRNTTAAGICFAGHGDLEEATEAQWLAAEWLIAEGVDGGHLTPNPTISGHRNYSTKGKTCPGNLIYPHIGRLRGITGHEEDDMPTTDEFVKAMKAAGFVTFEQLKARTGEVHQLEKAQIGLVRTGLSAIAAKVGAPAVVDVAELAGELAPLLADLVDDSIAAKVVEVLPHDRPATPEELALAMRQALALLARQDG